jgi:hypothetical protein
VRRAKKLKGGGAKEYRKSIDRRMNAQERRLMKMKVAIAYSDGAMFDNAALVVWTRGQMNGIRATIKRLGMVKGTE